MYVISESHFAFRGSLGDLGSVMFKMHATMGAVALSLASVSAAHATSLLFTFTGTFTASFTLPSDPARVRQGGFDAFYLNNIPVEYNGVTSVQPYVDFYFPAEDGGVTVGQGVDVGSPYLFDLYNTVLYSGKATAPHFFTGTFPLSTIDGGPNNETLRITSPGAVPEPASWAMFIGGFGLLGAAMRRRPNRVAFA